MAKASKATKKFQKSHLKRAVDQRKIEQSYKKKVLKNKKKEKGSAINGEEDEKMSGASGAIFDDMSVEDFMNGGFELPKMKKGFKKQPSKRANDSDDDDDVTDHKNDLKELAKRDPKFYKYLQENDKELLNFDPTIEVYDEEDEGDKNVDSDEVLSDHESSGQIEVTSKLVKEWKMSLIEENSLKALKKIVQAFSAAIKTGQEKDQNNVSKYTITNPNVFNELLVVTLTKVPATIQHHVPLKNHAPIESKKLKGLTHCLKSYAASLVVLLSSNHDSKTVNLILKSVQRLIPYFLSFRRVVKDLINAVVILLCETQDDLIKLATTGFLHEAAQAHPKSLLELVLKSSYSGLIKISRKTTVHTMPAINLLKNSISTLYAIDPDVSYQISFQFIRQLAIHLRSSIVNKTAESYKAVYNWQYVHSLDFWSRVVCQQCDIEKEALGGKPSALRELIHPLVQVTLGCIRLIPTPQYFPLRFYLTRSLLRISHVTGVYIPLLPIMTEILSSTTITKKPSPSTLKPLDFDHNIRAAKSYIGTKVYQDGVCEQFVDLVGEFFVLYTKSIAFPELAIPAIITFKRFIKKSHNTKFSKQLQKLVEKLDENSKFILQKRNNVEFGPTDKEQVSAFLKDLEWQKTPLGAFVVVQREIREEKLRLLRESLEDSEEGEDKDDKLNGLEDDEEDDEE